MFETISVLVPTRHRVQRLQHMLRSFIETSGSNTAEVIFRVDNDDVESQEYLHHRRVFIGPRYDGYNSMPRFFNEMAAIATGDLLLCGNDDMIFRTSGWPQRLLAVANQFPDGIFDLGVSTLNEAHYPFSVVSRKVVDRMGYLWHPSIFWGDIFLRDVMAHFGRCVMVPDVHIEHAWAGYDPDQTFVEADKDIVRRIPNYWGIVHALAVEEAIGKLTEVKV